MEETQPFSLESQTGNDFYNVNYVKLDPFVEYLKDFFQNTFNFSFESFDRTADTVLAVLAIFFMTLIAYCAVRLLEIRKREHEHLHHEIHEYAHKQKEKEEKKVDLPSNNPRWLQVLEYTFSQNPGDWKLAIIEADSMLADLVEQLGFPGENIGERLKNADQDSFKHLTRAWEVHTVRNRIAHEGVNFQLSAIEAKRLVAIYEDIFRTYGFI